MKMARKNGFCICMLSNIIKIVKENCNMVRIELDKCGKM
jgi:hypothetical protein